MAGRHSIVRTPIQLTASSFLIHPTPLFEEERYASSFALLLNISMRPDSPPTICNSISKSTGYRLGNRHRLLIVYLAPTNSRHYF